MLQRAASNAYSWWWASHIRTKQSKWMEQNLQDMEEKVQNVLRLIEEDGDSFARRAEMYYKKRPELIYFVEESYRAYRALAERYDHISTELQNANNTIASVFPEQVQFAMDEEDEEAMPKVSKKPPEIGKANIPKVPKAPITDLKSVITSATKKLKSKKTSKMASLVSVVKSGLSKPEACQEIDKLQKQILSLQTEKEFLKSSYESGLAKYWEIENQIKEMQERVFKLQDEFGEGMVIEDDEARNLMAKAALKSCQESLVQLQEKQERSAEEARIESTRIREARERLESLKGNSQGEEDKPHVGNEHQKQKVPDCLDREADGAAEERQRVDELRQKLKEDLESNTCLTMTEMAEKIDELVNKVIGLETALSSQTALVKQLRSETDELQAQIRNLEDDKASVTNGKGNLKQKLEEMEEKLGEIQNLNQKVNSESSNLQIHFIEAHCNLDHLSETLPGIKIDEELEPNSSSSTTVLKQPNDELKAQPSSNDIGQIHEGLRTEEPVIEMKSSKHLSPKDESLNLEGGFEKADASGTTRNQVGDGLREVNSVTSVSNSKKSAADGTVRSQVEVVESEGNSQNSEGNIKKSDADGTVRSQFEVVESGGNSQNSEGNIKKFDADGTVRSQLEVVQSEGNSQNSEGNIKKSDADGTVRSQLEVVESEGNSQNSEGNIKKSYDDDDDTTRSQVEFVQTQEKSINLEGNSEVCNISAARNSEEVIETKASSQSVECGSEKVDANETSRIQDEAIHNQANLESPSEKTNDVKDQDGDTKKTSSPTVGEPINIEPEEEITEKGEEPNWQQLFLSGMEDREKLLLTEYTTTLRNFKDVKKKLNEMDVKHHSDLLQTSKQLNELKTTNALKDEEIRSLRHKLMLMQKCFYESKESTDSSAPDHQKTSNTLDDQNSKPTKTEILTALISTEEETDDISKLLVHQPAITSVIEERLRMKIDELLEENLDFWLKFSTSFHQIQQFETGIQDLKSEVAKLQEKGKKLDEGGSMKYTLKSEARPLYKHLREIQTELTVWTDKSAALKDELQSRFSSLCNIQEEITAGLKASAEDDDFSFTSYQAAKFQGEVLNMKQENNKVADELQAALDHLATLQLDVDNTLSKLNEEFRLSGSKKQETPQLRHSESRNRVPLRSFIFGIKPKKQRPSIFSGMAPVMNRKYYGLKAGPPM